MYIATPEQPASYLFITRTSHLNHTRPQNAPHATHKFRVLLRLVLNARTQPSFDQTDDGVKRRNVSFSFSLSAFLSLFSAFALFLALTIGQYIRFSCIDSHTLRIRIIRNRLIRLLQLSIFPKRSLFVWYVEKSPSPRSKQKPIEHSSLPLSRITVPSYNF